MNTRKIMIHTLLGLVPGTVMYIYQFGLGVFFNVLICILFALATDGIVFALRRRSWQIDFSSLLTAALLGLCLPPLLPLWMAALATVFALLFGKHIYGGTGNNVFNPAMVGYAVLIVSFPLAMSFWPAGAANNPDQLVQAKLAWTQMTPAFDSVTSATPLDGYKFREAMTNQEYFNGTAADQFNKWLAINMAFLIGGLYLIYTKIITWQVPATYLGTLTVLSVLFYDGGSSASLGSPLFHLMTGATMMAAFFIITDPVSRPSLSHGVIVFAAGVAFITYIIRTIGGYPEGVAFAVLLMNAASPLIDHCILRLRQANHVA